MHSRYQPAHMCVSGLGQSAYQPRMMSTNQNNDKRNARVTPAFSADFDPVRRYKESSIILRDGSTCFAFVNVADEHTHQPGGDKR